MSRKGFVTIAIALVVVGLLAVGSGIYYYQKNYHKGNAENLPSNNLSPDQTVPKTPQTRDDIRFLDVRFLLLNLELYFEAHHSYPETLEKLIGTNNVFSIPKDPLTQKPYTYVVKRDPNSKDRFITFHLGATFETNTSSFVRTALNGDADLDSRGDGWIGGFDGSDGKTCKPNDTGIACYDLTRSNGN